MAALKKLGVRAAVGFSAVGSLREEVKPRDFLVAGGVVDWTKGVSLHCRLRVTLRAGDGGEEGSGEVGRMRVRGGNRGV